MGALNSSDKSRDVTRFIAFHQLRLEFATHGHYHYLLPPPPPFISPVRSGLLLVPRISEIQQHSIFLHIVFRSSRWFDMTMLDLL